MHAVNMQKIGFGLFSFVKKGGASTKAKDNKAQSNIELDGALLSAQSADRNSFNVLM
jgi:hypothetical protein